KLEQLLVQTNFLMGEQVSLADIAIFPFIRQFSAVDADWFASTPYVRLKAWLSLLVESELFNSIMGKYPVYSDAPN
ncbi:MAG: glutathione S-transferase, partial [Methylotenera sp.]